MNRHISGDSPMTASLTGERTGAYVATFAESPDDFRWENLRNYDAVFLNNTLGDLFPTPVHRESFSRFIKKGCGLVANHAASVTATNWDEYARILGAKGAAHRSEGMIRMCFLEDSPGMLLQHMGSRHSVRPQRKPCHP